MTSACSQLRNALAARLAAGREAAVQPRWAHIPERDRMTTITGFEDFAVGQVFTSRPQLMDAAGIKAFAAQFDT